MAEERLQKIMAAAGIGSRRACEQLIVAGKVRVNGQVVTELGTKADPELMQITVDGKPIRLPDRHVYFKLHKPRGVLSDTGDDPEGRRAALDLLPAELRRVFPVGRLDLLSEGLMLFTDDGDLAHRLTHPRFQHPKTYFVLVERRPGESELGQFRRGVDLPEGRTAPASVRIVERPPAEVRLGPGPTAGVWLEVILREGKKRQIRHMISAIGHVTLRLVRWAIGPLTLGSLEVGAHRPLTHAEMGSLRQMVAGQPRPTPPTPRPTANPPTRPRRPPSARPGRPTTASRGPQRRTR